MKQETPLRIAVVTRETRLEKVLARYSTRGMARHRMRLAQRDFALRAGAADLDFLSAAESAGEEDFEELEDEDATYRHAVQELVRSLDFDIPVQTLPRAFLPTYDFGRCAVVVVIGQDGLVANAAKYVGHVPIVGVNPDPSRFDGVLLPFAVTNAHPAVARILNGNAALREVTLAEAQLQDGQRLLAFNDLFIGARSHVSARYTLRAGGSSERQSSSGVLVSTGAGSTGWMSSVYNMARGVAATLGAPIAETRCPCLGWDDRSLLWAVREPFRSQTTGASLVCGRLREGDGLTIESEMAAGGVIFSDGVEEDFLEFTTGTLARIDVARQRARLAVPTHGGR